MNETMKNLLERRSIRRYKPDPIPDEVLEQVLQAGTYAPTAKNSQSPIILCVTNRELRDKLSAMNAAILGVDSDPFFGAPVVLVVLADRNIYSCVNDGTLVMANLMLAAKAMGLGSCWINRAREGFDTEEGKQILRDLGIQGDYVGIGHCILGYQDGPDPKPAPRKENYVYYVR